MSYAVTYSKLKQYGAMLAIVQNGQATCSSIYPNKCAAESSSGNAFLSKLQKNLAPEESSKLPFIGKVVRNLFKKIKDGKNITSVESTEIDNVNSEEPIAKKDWKRSNNVSRRAYLKNNSFTDHIWRKGLLTKPKYVLEPNTFQRYELNKTKIDLFNKSVDSMLNITREAIQDPKDVPVVNFLIMLLEALLKLPSIYLKTMFENTKQIMMIPQDLNKAFGQYFYKQLEGFQIWASLMPMDVIKDKMQQAVWKLEDRENQLSNELNFIFDILGLVYKKNEIDFMVHLLATLNRHENLQEASTLFNVSVFALLVMPFEKLNDTLKELIHTNIHEYIEKYHGDLAAEKAVYKYYGQKAKLFPGMQKFFMTTASPLRNDIRKLFMSPINGHNYDIDKINQQENITLFQKRPSTKSIVMSLPEKTSVATSTKPFKQSNQGVFDETVLSQLSVATTVSPKWQTPTILVPSTKSIVMPLPEKTSVATSTKPFKQSTQGVFDETVLSQLPVATTVSPKWQTPTILVPKIKIKKLRQLSTISSRMPEYTFNTNFFWIPTKTPELTFDTNFFWIPKKTPLTSLISKRTTEFFYYFYYYDPLIKTTLISKIPRKKTPLISKRTTDMYYYYYYYDADKKTILQSKLSRKPTIPVSHPKNKKLREAVNLSGYASKTRLMSKLPISKTILMSKVPLWPYPSKTRLASKIPTLPYELYWQNLFGLYYKILFNTTYKPGHYREGITDRISKENVPITVRNYKSVFKNIDAHTVISSEILKSKIISNQKHTQKFTFKSLSSEKTFPKPKTTSSFTTKRQNTTYGKGVIIKRIKHTRAINKTRSTNKSLWQKTKKTYQKFKTTSSLTPKRQSTLTNGKGVIIKRVISNRRKKKKNTLTFDKTEVKKIEYRGFLDGLKQTQSSGGMVKTLTEKYIDHIKPAEKSTTLQIAIVKRANQDKKIKNLFANMIRLGKDFAKILKKHLKEKHPDMLEKYRRIKSDTKKDLKTKTDIVSNVEENDKAFKLLKEFIVKDKCNMTNEIQEAISVENIPSLKNILLDSSYTDEESLLKENIEHALVHEDSINL